MRRSIPLRRGMFIAIEGVIGVGKTTLAKLLSLEMGAHYVPEIVEENPYLAKFYDDIEAWAFQTEMFFLCHRQKQLQDIECNHLARGESVVADFTIYKNMLFAARTLKGKDLQIYREIYDVITRDLPRPDLIVCLEANMDSVVERIARRGRDIERSISREYLQSLAEAYSTWESADYLPDIPILRIDNTHLDCLHNPADRRETFRRITGNLALEVVA